MAEEENSDSSIHSFPEVIINENIPDANLELFDVRTEEINNVPNKDFYSECLSKIRISTKNTSSVLQQEKQVKSKDPFNIATFDKEESIDDVIQKQLDNIEVKNRRRSTLNNNRPKPPPPLISQKNIFEPGSCFSWFVIKGKCIRDIIPDYELFHCRAIFNNLLKSNQACYEAIFGLAKLLAHESKYDESIQLVKDALKLKPNDQLFQTWYAFLQMKNARKTKSEALKNKALFESLLRNYPNEIELLWGLMELSLSGLLAHRVEIEVPQHYATKIKDIDNYYGYLAWSAIFSSEGKEQKSLDIIKELARLNPTKPEAHLFLWDYYYHKIQDYSAAEDVSTEAFLKITEYECYNVLSCIKYAKSLFKNGKYRNCFELLQQKFLEHPTYTVFLYQYGKLCTKSEDYSFNGSAIGALQECLRICDKGRYGVIHYWLAKAFLLGRHPIDAYYSMESALECLELSEQKKIDEMNHEMKNFKEQIEALESVENFLKGRIITIEGIERYKLLSKKVKDLHRFSGDILLAKILWAEGHQEEALSVLTKTAAASGGRLAAYFQLYEYLWINKDYNTLKQLCKDMIKKCKNHQIPTKEWMKAHILYSKVLVKNSNPAKAILLLKCLAKVFPPLPFSSVQYTKHLQKATSIKDLQDLSNIQKEGPSNEISEYLESLTKSESPRPLRERRLLTDQAMDEENEEKAGEEIELPIVEVNERRSFSLRTRNIKKFNSLSIMTEFEDEEMEMILNNKGNIKNLNAPLPTGEGAYVGFSICSEPTFLYKIGKIAASFGVMIEDGLFAIHDYILLLVYERDPVFYEKRKSKALYWKVFLFLHLNDHQSALALIPKIRPSFTPAKIEKLNNMLRSKNIDVKIS
ncbi:unnamed protein product [Blepharisma stoltei]|uniref:Tetratricopeptide repeat protein n=1 Tax=Blepharisma stoltei TaxID=1481888 RepID=A0AAU9JT20_9CILI|nr:unnamed protein product [Blepharisma stoltei]